MSRLIWTLVCVCIALSIRSGRAGCSCSGTDECCGGTSCYNPATALCCDGVVQTPPSGSVSQYECCGTTLYPNATQYCCFTEGCIKRGAPCETVACAFNQTCGKPTASNAFCFDRGLELCSTDVAHALYDPNASVCCNGNDTGAAVIVPKVNNEDSCCYDPGANEHTIFNSDEFQCCANCGSFTPGTACTSICSEGATCAAGTPPQCLNDERDASCYGNSTTCSQALGYFPEQGNWGCCEIDADLCEGANVCFEEEAQTCCGLVAAGGPCAQPNICDNTDACMLNECNGVGTCYDDATSAVCERDGGGCTERRLYDLNSTICCGGELFGRPTHFCCNDTAIERSSPDEDCCAGQLFSTTTHECCGGVLRELATTTTQCCGNQVVTASRVCCAGTLCETGAVCSPSSVCVNDTATSTTTGGALPNATTTGTTDATTTGVSTTTGTTTGGLPNATTTAAVSTTGATTALVSTTTVATTGVTTGACTEAESFWVTVVFLVPEGQSPNEAAIRAELLALMEGTGVSVDLVVIEPLTADVDSTENRWRLHVRVCGDESTDAEDLARILAERFSSEEGQARLENACEGCVVEDISFGDSRDAAASTLHAAVAAAAVAVVAALWQL